VVVKPAVVKPAAVAATGGAAAVNGVATANTVTQNTTTTQTITQTATITNSPGAKITMDASNSASNSVNINTAVAWGANSTAINNKVLVAIE
jgi:hypothetical protein